jgi:hypothetical protein
MAKSTLTVVLSGEILLADFAAGIERFRGLIDALGKEVAAGIGIEWRLEDLAPGSALTTIRGVARREQDQPRVDEVVDAYGRVGAALESGQSVPYSNSVVKAADELVRVINERVESIRLETEDEDWTISQETVAPLEDRGGISEPAFGAVEGRVQTLSSRGGLRFTLYDTLHDKAVSCYLAEGYEDIMRDAWGHLAIVEGIVKRDQLSGRPVTVRQVRSVQLLPEAGPDDYKKARGLIPFGPESSMPEEVIRKARDA